MRPAERSRSSRTRWTAAERSSAPSLAQILRRCVPTVFSETDSSLAISGRGQVRRETSHHPEPGIGLRGRGGRSPGPGRRPPGGGIRRWQAPGMPRRSPGSSAPPCADRSPARCPRRTAWLPGRRGTWPARRRRPGDRAAWPATASLTRSPTGGGAGDLVAPSRRLPGGRAFSSKRPRARLRPACTRASSGKDVHGRVACGVAQAGRRADAADPDGLPRRTVTGARSSALQGDGKGWPEPAHARLFAGDRFCGAPVARITMIR